MVDKGRFSEKLNFKYKTEYVTTADGGLAPLQKPKIEVTFRRFSESKSETNREFRVPALIDSGADYSFLPLKIATKILNLKIDETEERVLTVTGEAKVYKSEVYVEIPRRGLRPIPIGTIPVHIMQNEVDDKYLYKLIILGRKGFFEKFKVTFNESAKYITLQDLHKDEVKRKKGIGRF